MKPKKKIVTAFAFACVLTAATSASGQIAVAIIDGKQPVSGQAVSGVTPDKVITIDLRRGAPRVLGAVEAPVSMIGPPTSIAIARNGAFAIVTASQKLDPADPTKFVLDDRVSVIDLTNPAQPFLAQSVTAGAGASGVAINPAGTLALVAATGEGTVSVFTIKKRRLALAGKVKLSEQLGPVDVVISRDGKAALVTQRRGAAIWRLAIDGTSVTDTGVTFETGVQPYAVAVSRDGRYTYNTNLGGRPRAAGDNTPGPRTGTVTVIDVKTNEIVNTVDVGATPEHVTMSADGKFVALTIINGSTADPKAPSYNPFSLIKVYAIDGPKVTFVAEAKAGRWGQGMAWSDDGRTLLFQAAMEKAIQVFRFDGKTLTEDAAAAMTFEGRPGAVSTPKSR